MSDFIKNVCVCNNPEVMILPYCIEIAIKCQQIGHRVRLLYVHDYVYLFFFV